MVARPLPLDLSSRKQTPHAVHTLRQDTQDTRCSLPLPAMYVTLAQQAGVKLAVPGAAAHAVPSGMHVQSPNLRMMTFMLLCTCEFACVEVSLPSASACTCKRNVCTDPGSLLSPCRPWVQAMEGHHIIALAAGPVHTCGHSTYMHTSGVVVFLPSSAVPGLCIFRRVTPVDLQMEDRITADPFVRTSCVRVCVPPCVWNTIACDHPA